MSGPIAQLLEDEELEELDELEECELLLELELDELELEELEELEEFELDDGSMMPLPIGALLGLAMRNPIGGYATT